MSFLFVAWPNGGYCAFFRLFRWVQTGTQSQTRATPEYPCRKNVARRRRGNTSNLAAMVPTSSRKKWCSRTAMYVGRHQIFFSGCIEIDAGTHAEFRLFGEETHNKPIFQWNITKTSRKEISSVSRDATPEKQSALFKSVCRSYFNDCVCFRSFACSVFRQGVQ